ncbi:heat-inducible transcriptional repressor HrcA [Fusibacillus kribbianus]|uniref:Heat-inducible transcription repressor HrcA n=1 Tax=Fusibacillus kribbianus TaxID=3044208 RepID=A0AAP4B6Z8_9FIRM|nr:heat-inducible transcriptional repressor HrcA [Ruminococcus sp. YH-rum2234]MDI9240959.1 heat-inducible transcriptional repressor HrcA [Ruminococcus sp. YH-rum2234]
MELDERKKKILNAIIRNYQETGEPVGSRTISKYSDLQLSSATIRNEMADLEEMGLIVQPHTSAGRIPTDKGYRLYVDQMLKEADQDREHREVPQTGDFLVERMDRMERVLMQMAKLLAANTNYASMISAPRYNRNKLKFIQLSRVDERKLLAVVVVEGNIIKNSIFEVEERLSEEDILSLNLMLNTNLNGLTIEEINLEIIAKLKEQAGNHTDVIGKVLDAVADAIRSDEEDLQIYTSGATNIFKYPELSDSSKAKEIIQVFEEKEQLTNLLTDKLGEEGQQGIQVYIGNETPVQSMKDCSVVTATYDLGGGLQGTIGIVGPKRMDYEKVVSTLQTVMGQLDTIFKKEE